MEAAGRKPLDAVAVEDEAVEVVLRGEGAAGPTDLVELVAAEVEELEGCERGEEALGKIGEPRNDLKEVCTDIHLAVTSVTVTISIH